MKQLSDKTIAIMASTISAGTFAGGEYDALNATTASMIAKESVAHAKAIASAIAESNDRMAQYRMIEPLVSGHGIDPTTHGNAVDIPIDVRLTLAQCAQIKISMRSGQIKGQAVRKILTTAVLDPFDEFVGNLKRSSSDKEWKPA